MPEAERSVPSPERKCNAPTFVKVAAEYGRIYKYYQQVGGKPLTTLARNRSTTAQHLSGSTADASSCTALLQGNGTRGGRGLHTMSDTAETLWGWLLWVGASWEGRRSQRRC